MLTMQFFIQLDRRYPQFTELAFAATLPDPSFWYMQMYFTRNERGIYFRTRGTLKAPDIQGLTVSRVVLEEAEDHSFPVAGKYRSQGASGLVSHVTQQLGDATSTYWTLYVAAPNITNVLNLRNKIHAGMLQPRIPKALR